LLKTRTLIRSSPYKRVFTHPHRAHVHIIHMWPWVWRKTNIIITCLQLAHNLSITYTAHNYTKKHLHISMSWRALR